jgi:hypothetical protein
MSDPARLAAGLQLLASTADSAQIKQVQVYLTQEEQTNYPALVHGLAAALANTQTSPQERQHAGIALKNTLTAIDEQELHMRKQRWLALSEPQRTQIKGMVLQTLTDNNNVVRKATSLVWTQHTHTHTLAHLLPSVAFFSFLFFVLM